MNRKFRFFWLKYVTDVNLEKHCQAGLKGPIDKRITQHKNRDQSHWEDMILNQGESDFYYICGVAQPANWDENFHCVIRCVPGETLILDEQSVTGTILNAVRIPIHEMDCTNSNNPYKDNPKYYTCRNYQFALEFDKLTLKYGSKRKPFVEHKLEQIERENQSETTANK